MNQQTRKWAAAAIVAGVMAAQSVMAEPSREYEPINKGFDGNGSVRGYVTTESMREYEPVALPVGDLATRRGTAATEARIGFKVLASWFRAGGIRTAWLGL